jgi:hypothetical protein
MLFFEVDVKFLNNCESVLKNQFFYLNVLYFGRVLTLINIPDVTPMVQDAKAVAMNTQDTVAVSRWRESNRAVSFSYTHLSIQCFILSGKIVMSSTYHTVPLVPLMLARHGVWN